MKGTNLDDLNEHMFDLIERLKAGNDPDCDPKDSIKLETAKAIVGAAKVIVDISKVKVQAVGIVAKYSDPAYIEDTVINNGLIDGSKRLK